MKLQNSLPNSIGLGRRQFMALSAGTAMAGLFGPSVPASADTKAASLPVAQTGNGEWTYRTNPHWGELPAGTAFGGTHAAIATDKAGALYVSTQSSTGILVYDSDGKLQRRIASEYPEVHSMLHTEEEGKEYLYVTVQKMHGE